MTRKDAIDNLVRIIESEDFRHFHLVDYSDLYKSSIKNYKSKCQNCLELEKNNLPFDCLSKSNYCLKTKEDFEIINLYEELKFNIELK